MHQPTNLTILRPLLTIISHTLIFLMQINYPQWSCCNLICPVWVLSTRVGLTIWGPIPTQGRGPFLLSRPLPSPPFPLKVGFLNPGRRSGSAASSPTGSVMEPQSKSILVHCRLVIWHLVATFLMIFLRNNCPNSTPPQLTRALGSVVTLSYQLWATNSIYSLQPTRNLWFVNVFSTFRHQSSMVKNWQLVGGVGPGGGAHTMVQSAQWLLGHCCSPPRIWPEVGFNNSVASKDSQCTWLSNFNTFGRSAAQFDQRVFQCCITLPGGTVIRTDLRYIWCLQCTYQISDKFLCFKTTALKVVDWGQKLRPNLVLFNSL